MRLLALISLFIASSIQAQMCPCEFGKSGKIRRHEIGWNLLSLYGEPGSYRLPDKAILPIYLSGIQYKYHADNFSLRTHIAFKPYTFDDQQIFAPQTFTEKTKGNANFYELKLGIEKTIKSGKWRWYAALDLLYGFGRASGSQVRYNDLKTEINTKISYAGLSMVTGLNYRLNERLSLNLEPCFNMTQNKQNAQGRTETYFRSYILLNALSLNYHF